MASPRALRPGPTVGGRAGNEGVDRAGELVDALTKVVDALAGLLVSGPEFELEVVDALTEVVDALMSKRLPVRRSIQQANAASSAASGAMSINVPTSSS